MTLELNATPGEVMRAVEALQQLGQSKGIAEKTLFELSLALEECGSNIVNHALKLDAQQKFQAHFDFTGGAVIIELRDRGPEFDPTQAADVPLEAQDDDVPGGWGVQLVRRYMDEIRYRREDGQNILRLTKKLPPAAGQK